jgi:hypothetical protein
MNLILIWIIVALIAGIPWLYIMARILKQYKKYFVYIYKFTVFLIFIALLSYVAWDIWGGA